MRVRFPADRSRCLPFRVLEEEEGPDGYLGGAPPESVTPPVGSTFFLTLLFGTDPTTFVSLSVADYESLARVRGHLNEAGLVQFTTHATAHRGRSADFTSQVSPRGLIVLPEEDDRMPDGEGGELVRSGHKLGGQPHLIRETVRLRESFELAHRAGFSYAFQVDFPGPDDAPVSGPWPFGDGILGVFARPPFGAVDWRWWWDF